MNESNIFNPFSINNFCRVCLKTTNDLGPMSDEHINLYKSIVGEIANEDYSNKACTICQWMLQRFNKFKHQCQSANNLLKEATYMDSKSLIFLRKLTSSHRLTQTEIVTHDYVDTFNDINDHCNNFINDRNDHCNDFINDTDDYHDKIDDPFNNTLVGARDNHDRLGCDTFDNHILDGTRNDKIKTDDNDIMINDTHDYDNYDNNIFIDNEDEIPLVLLSKSIGKIKKKKKKKINKETNIQNAFPSEESVVKKEQSDHTVLKPRKTKKELRDGFSSRMVQETDEYIVIKLTRDQVIQEMSQRSKTDAYIRSPFKCEQCVKGFNFEDVLQTHLDKHSMKNGSFQCDMCGQYCPSTVSLRGHIKSHTTRYKCKLCGHTRLSRQHLLEHHAITHTNAAISYNCDYCQFTTNKRTVMQRHVRRHSSVEPHACHKCGKLFKTVETLRLHTVRHDKSFRFRCDRCDKSFVYHSLLRRHIQCVHERREFYCVECDVQFTSAESLRLHFKKAKKHRDSSAYNHSCPPSPPSLSAPLTAAHARPPHHACTHCRRLYSTRDALRAHVWRVHSRGDVRATCPHCPATFARKSTLKLHIRTHTDARGDVTAHAPDKHTKEKMQPCEDKIEV